MGQDQRSTHGGDGMGERLRQAEAALQPTRGTDAQLCVLRTSIAQEGKVGGRNDGDFDS